MPSSKPSRTDSVGKPGIAGGSEMIWVDVAVVAPVVVIVDVVSSMIVEVNVATVLVTVSDKVPPYGKVITDMLRKDLVSVVV